MSASLTEARAALASGAVIEPPRALATITAEGRDRKTWLNGLVTCELAKLAAGQGAFGLAVTKTGKIMTELRIAETGEALAIACEPEFEAALLDHFERHLIMEDVELASATEARAWLFVHGPRALEIARGALGALDAAQVIALDSAGLGGAACLVAPDAVDDAVVKLVAAGAASVSAEAWEALRIERAVPRFGVDYDAQNYPQEAALEARAVSFQKGCYLGQETVFMLQMRGHVKKRLVQLRIEGADVADVAPRAPIVDEAGAETGFVTSRTEAPEPGAVIALGYVKYKRARDGEALRVNGRVGTVIGLAIKPDA